MIRVRYRRALATILAMISMGASAQRAEENAITTATDAFGTGLRERPLHGGSHAGPSQPALRPDLGRSSL